MRVALVQPAEGSRFGFAKLSRGEPLGLECVGAALRHGGHDVHLVDLRLERAKALVALLRSWRPRAVGLACAFTTDVHATLQTARGVREALPRAGVFVGGHHAALVPGDFLFPGSPVEAVAIGEGEAIAPDLVGAFERQDDVGAVPGVMTLLNRGKGFRPRAGALDLGALPLPDRALSLRHRRSYHHGIAARAAWVEVSRRSAAAGAGPGARRFQAEQIADDLRVVASLGGEHALFADEDALADRELYLELADRAGAARLALRYACEARPEVVVERRDLVERWAALGLDAVLLRTARTGGGGALAPATLDAIELLRGAGVRAMASLVADPSWGEDEFDRVEELARRARLREASIAILTPLPGTERWDALKPQLASDDYGSFDGLHLVLPTRLGRERFYERIARLQRLAGPRAPLRFGGVPVRLRLALRGDGRVGRRVAGALRGLRRPRAYLKDPGTTPKPRFVPPDFGSARWVDGARAFGAVSSAAAP
jgi:radical SAM superfamily enzyme YgiQ (UPF0313 family)